MGDNSNFVFCQKLVGEDGSVRWGIAMVKQGHCHGEAARSVHAKVGAMSSHVFTVAAKLRSRTQNSQFGL